MDEQEKEVKYIPVYQKRLAKYLLLAKGKDRTMAEFAELCNANPTTFSRVVKGTIAKPLDVELIKTIAENSADPLSASLDDLMRANGMVRDNDEEASRRVAQKRFEERSRLMEEVQSIIMQELFSRGFTIGPVLGTPLEQSDPTLKRSRFPLSRAVRFAFRVAGYEPAFWNFTVNAFNGEVLEGREDYKREIHLESSSFIIRYSDVFLRDMWEPEAFENSKFSIVMIHRDLFDEVLKRFEGVKVKNDISLILVDTKEQRIAQEYVFPRYEGKAPESFLAQPKHSFASRED